jgi:putative ABC transport system permease protein
VLGSATLLLALAGIYARVAYRVAGRQREWAIRQAIGATPARLRALIVADVVAVTGVGVLAGIAALPMASSVVSGVYGSALLDWRRAIVLGTLLCVAALAAAHGPSSGPR